MRSKFLPLTRQAYYARNLQALVQQLRTFSSRTPNGSIGISDVPEQKVFMGPRDFRTPLPGNVGIAQYFLTFSSMPVQRPLPPVTSPGPVLLAESLSGDPTLDDKEKNVLSQLLSGAFETSKTVPSGVHVLECVAQDCPSLLKKDLAYLFVNRDLASHHLTVLTLSQKTDSDMSAWSQDMETERDLLMEQFVQAAQEICDFLGTHGYWADFIDPSSGTPFNGPYTTATFFETDERYRYLGFKIEDLGCCKVISHKLWGTHAFVGSLFTNAPMESAEVQDILERHQCT